MAVWAARRLGTACALGATGLGIAYLAAAGAPLPYIAIQAGALGIGLVSIVLVTRIGAILPDAASGALILLLGAMLLATAFFGMSVDGAARWVRFGAISVQTSLVLVPPMLLLFASSPGRLGTVAIAAATLALALQPDRAMAGALGLALLALALVHRNALTITAAACGLAGFVAALMQPDALPAVPFVDRILYTAFDIHPLIGAAVVAGALTLILPAFGGGARGPRVVFGATWLAIVSAAALGNYPTPLVGYGGSAVLGYLLSVALLPGAPLARASGAAIGSVTRNPDSRDELLRTATV